MPQGLTAGCAARGLTWLLMAGAFTLASPMLGETATAAELRRGVSTMTYTAEPGEENALTLSRNDGQYVFTDTGATGVTDGGGCTSAPQCDVTDVTTIEIFIGDGDRDAVTVEDSVFPSGSASPSIIVHGGPGIDTMTGGIGSERFDGDEGADKLDGGGGDDVLRGGGGTDEISGGDGDDRLDFPVAGDEDEASAGVDTMIGNAGNDQLNGGDGSSASDADTLTGGAGFDTADFSARSAPLTIDLEIARGDGEAGEDDEVQRDVERIVAGSEGDRLNGSASLNVLEGRGGDDTINGRGGDDALSGGGDSGTDEISGGAGNDTIDGGGGEDDLRGGDDDDVVSGGGGGDDLDGGDGGDTLHGGPGIDKLDGAAGNDTLDGAEPGITGADGGDDLSGGAGTDTLAGGRGNDTMDGGAGPDTMDGDAGRDTVTYANRSGPVTVTLDGVANDGEDGEGDNVLRTVEEVVGGSMDDTLSGDADDNAITGASGEDDLRGDSGRDELTGGNATDLIRARDGRRDVVACGDDQDIAITDPQDLVRDCETEDQGGRRRLAAGRTALVTPARGDFGLQPPDAGRYFTLAETLMIPIGSTIDATDAEVRVATAASRGGRRRTIFASGGIFSLRQRRGGRSAAELRLRGPFGKCPRPSGRRRGAVMQEEPKRRLRTRIVKAKKRFKVRGKYSIGAAKGTIWWTEERCDGTLTRVESGSVRVQDLVLDRTVTVRAGDTYLAKPR